MPDWVLPAAVCSAIFYIIPAAICYWSYKIGDKKSKPDHDICFVPAFNMLLALFSIPAIWEHYFPEPENPTDPNAVLRKAIEELKDGTAAKRERRQDYAFGFIASRTLQQDFDEYCEAMELMRTMKDPEAK